MTTDEMIRMANKRSRCGVAHPEFSLEPKSTHYVCEKDRWKSAVKVVDMYGNYAMKSIEVTK